MAGAAHGAPAEKHQPRRTIMMTAWTAIPMLDRLLDDVMNDVTGTALGTAATKNGYTPAIDVRASEEEIVFVCDVPGVKKEDLEITILRDVLTLKGQRRYEGNDKDRVWLGRSYGNFTRSFTLPDAVDPERMSADLTDGVLTVKVPKLPKVTPRRIEIGSGR
jgi:HSP20 family protein